MRTNTLIRAAALFTCCSLGACASCEPAGDAPRPDEEGARRIALLTGSSGSSGNLDGPREVALFSAPSGVARAPDGSVFVADASNAVIRKIAPDGEVTTFAGRSGELGTEDGAAEDARFLLPVAVVVDADGVLYVSDTAANTIRRVQPDGTVDTWAGKAEEPGTVDGPRAAARLLNPEGLALTPDGALLVADRTAHTIRKVAADGSVITLVGAPGQAGHADGDLDEARLAGPFGVAVADDGTIAISESDNNDIRLITPDGIVSTLAGTPGGPQSTADGVGAAAGFGRPRALVFFPDSAAPTALLVADTFNDRLRHVTLPDGASAGGVVSTWAGSSYGFEDGPRLEATLSFPSGFSLADEDGARALYLAEAGTSLVRRIAIDGAQDVVSTFAGRAFELGFAEGDALSARYFRVSDALALEDGSTLLVDSVNHVIRRLRADGEVSVFAGAPGVAGADDGPRQDARFTEPHSIIEDGHGGFFVSDQGNHTIRRIDADGEVSLFAGGPVGRGPELLDGALSEALFFAPAGMFLVGDIDDASAGGTLYVADAGNHAIRAITAGEVTTLAGEGRPGYAEGTGSAARFQLPTDVLVMGGALYVADSRNHVVRKVDLESGAVTTFVGAPGVDEAQPREGDADGVGADASFRTPTSLLADGADAMLIADSNNSLVRRATRDGAVSTLAGTRGSLGIVEGALPGSLFEPQALARAQDGAVIVTFFTGALTIGE